MNVAPEKKGMEENRRGLLFDSSIPGVIVRHVEYEITSLVKEILLIYRNILCFVLSVTKTKSLVDTMISWLYMNFSH